MTNAKEPIPSQEPSVWDYFSKKIRFWSRNLPDQEAPPAESPAKKIKSMPWFVLTALILALIAQLTLEPSPGRSPWPGVVLYAAATGCLVTAIFRDEIQLPQLKKKPASKLKTTFKMEFLIISAILSLFSFLLFGSGVFGLLNTFLWLLSILFIFLAFWQKSDHETLKQSNFVKRFIHNGWQIQIKPWTLIVLAAFLVVLFFNFHRLESVPPEMVSDQAEKLLDIHDILSGQTPVYFWRNTGREVLHFYLTAAYLQIFNLDVSFFNLKVVAVFANLLTLFFIYLLGKELGNKWVGLGAGVFAGIAYWPLLFTRLALRIPYYPLFVAPVMYFFVRGLRHQRINDVLWAGLFLGLGLHGYTPFRIVPLLIVLGTFIYFLHRQARHNRLQSVFALILIALISLIVFIPLLRYWLANPDLFAYRAFSRLTGMEVGFADPPLVIFLQNFWKASVMFFWDNGVIWAHSVPNRPALEIVSGALYFLGIVSLIIRYIRRRHWADLFLLVSIPVLLMPSILSLAYPGENPSLNRTAGAVVPVFVVVGLALESIIRAVREGLPRQYGKIVVVLMVLVMLIWSGANNYDLVFNQYYKIYQASSWNTSEIGAVARFFIESLGSPQTTYVVGYPHWVDSRLVAINSGFPGYDYAILPDQIAATAENTQSKMFFVNVVDTENMQLLLDTFPTGVLWQFDSELENKDFMIFFVPPMQGALP